MRNLKTLRALIERPQTRLVSVDVFDTLLLRDTIPEPVRFRAISELQHAAICNEGNSEIGPLAWYRLRQEAARTVYFTKTPKFGAREASWHEIFHVLLATGGVPANQTNLDSCLEIELQYESQRLRLNKPLWQLLRAAQAQGKPVVFISDMYLNASCIGELINRALGHVADLKIYSSAEFGFGKSSGEIFRVAANEASVRFDQMVHCGDNRHADFEVPSSLGISACYLPRPLTWRLISSGRTFWFNRQVPPL